MQAERNRDGEIVHQRAEGRAFLVHVDEDFAQATIFIFAGAEIDLVTTDNRLLGVTLTTIRQTLAVTHALNALDNTLDDLFCHRCSARCRRLSNHRFHCIIRFIFIIGDELRIQRLRELRTIAIKRIRLQREFPREHVSALAVFHRRIIRHVDGFRNRTRDEGLRCRHHANVAFNREITLADAAARIGAIEHRIMFDLEVRSAFERHRPANMDVCCFDVSLREAEEGEEFERRIIQLIRRNIKRPGEEVVAQRPFVEHELDVEGRRHALFNSGDLLIREALGAQRRMVDAGSLCNRTMANGIGFDFCNLAFRIAECAERFWHRAVDDLEVTATGELLELHEREVRFDTGRVAIHHETDRAGRRDHGCLRIAIAMLFTECERFVPRDFRAFDEDRLRARLMIKRNWVHAELFIPIGFAMRSAAMVAHHAQHVISVLFVAREWAQFLRHFSGGLVSNAGHDCGERAADCTALIGIIRNAVRHQEAANIGVAQAKRAVFVGEFSNFLGRELRHQHRDLEHHRPQTNSMFV